MSRTVTYTKTASLVVVDCPACGIEYGIPEELDKRLLEKKAELSVYCPNGHQWHYTGRSLADQLKAARAQVTHAEDQRRAAERSAAAYRGQITRLRNRIGNGVCPCCNRTFQNLAMHMQRQHPEFRNEGEPA